MDLKEEHILKDAVHEHWYYVSKAAALLRFTRHIKADTVMDVGAGSGVFSKMLLAKGGYKRAVCIDPGYKTEGSELYDGKNVEFVKGIDRSNAGLVLMMDVLEHVDDDAGLVGEYAGKVECGTHFLITVPAFQYLFSGHDMFLGHKRRYDKKTLTSCLNAGGLRVLRTRYFFFCIFPLAAIIRLWGGRFTGADAEPRCDLKAHGAFVNNLLVMIHRAELLLFPYNGAFGLSIFCLAVKD